MSVTIKLFTMVLDQIPQSQLIEQGSSMRLARGLFKDPQHPWGHNSNDNKESK